VQRKNEGARDSRTCSGSRRRRDRAEAGAGALAARVATAAELRQRKCNVEDARAGQHGVGRAAARQGSDAWNCREQEVALESLRWRAAVKHGSGRQLSGVSRRVEASARPVSGGAEARAARGRAQSGARVAGAAHMAMTASAAHGRGKQRRGGER
jgi:hypothetical protein